MCKVTVVIPNYNGKHFLQDCLHSLMEQTEREFEILLVDNGSKDGSAQYVQEHFPVVRLLELSQNYGFCRAVNEGIRLSRAPYVILLNNDTRVEPDFVRELLLEIDKNERIFSCQAKMLQMADPERMDDGGNYYCALGWAFAYGKGKRASEYEEPRKIFASCGGAAIYRKQLIREIGLLDEVHFAYLEDVDWGYRAKIEGYENRYVPGAVVYHAGSGTTGSRYNGFKIRYSARNSIYLIYKNMPFLQILINIPFFLIGFTAKLVFFWRKGYRREYLKGLGEGFTLSKKEKKVKFRVRNIKNYLKIQLELWINIKKRLENLE